MASVLDCAKFFAKCGYSPLPIRTDGSKRPAVPTWDKAQEAIPSEWQLEKAFNERTGIALIQGRVSGGGQGQCAEVLEIETEEVYQEWRLQMHALGYGPLCDSMNLVCMSGGGGIHVYYRYIGEPEGNQKLAFAKGAIEGHKAGSDGYTCIIETRSEGGCVIAPGSPSKTHKSGNLYRVLSGTFKSVPVLTAAERAQVFDAAKILSEKPEKVYTAPKFTAPVMAHDGMKPGDDFNLRGAHEAMACLERHGWLVASEEAGYYNMVRPGKGRREGASATFGKVAPGVLHCFSSNAAPFDVDGNYGPFAILALLDYGGDYKACTRYLVSLGFGGERAELKPAARVRPLPVPEVTTKWPSLKDIPEAPDFEEAKPAPKPEPIEYAPLTFELEAETPVEAPQKPEIDPELLRLAKEAELGMLEVAEADFWQGWKELSLLFDALPRMEWQYSPGVHISDVALWVRLAMERCRKRKTLYKGSAEWMIDRAGLGLCEGFDRLFQDMENLRWWVNPEAVAPCR